MKRTRSMMILKILMMMLILQLSCAAPKNEQGYKEPPVSPGQTQTAAIVTEAVLLGDKHQANGMACSDCHEETSPAVDVPSSVCLNCHADYDEADASHMNPHNAHMRYTHCGDCHHAHRVSENKCLNCHSFSMKTP
ncbi:MAG TPA: cytochrome c3 family protein [Desulfatiglandales bacterium]|nr:cytochrome c3 family protein [Desulfatiglandales bacterium]